MLYTLGIYLYGFILKMGALFHPKAKKWVNGRRQFFQQLPQLPQQRVIWFHCASMGEYDQGKPIMEEWKKKYPDDFILVTFFSPSGYEAIVKKSVGDYTCYLPLDTPSNARKFIAYFQPSIAFFVKYEVWINFLKEAHKNKCKLYSISVTFRREQTYFKWYGGKFRKALALFNHIFVQNEESKALLTSIDINNVTVSGDTRYDRVAARANTQNNNLIFEKWLNTKKAFIIGSSWPADEEIILPFINSPQFTQNVIIAPHEVHKTHIEAIIKKIDCKFQLYTAIQNGEVLDASTKIIILDCIGVLADAYRYGDCAYVGGAFGTGLHNILEPAAFGLPVIFGPHYSKFPEATLFIQQGIARNCSNTEELQNAFHFLSDQENINQKVRSFIQQNRGATTAILEYLIPPTAK